MNSQCDGERTKEALIHEGSEPGLLRAERALGERVGRGLLAGSDRIFAVHAGGKLRVEPRVPIDSAEMLSLVDTPGAGRVSAYLAEHPEASRDLTGKGTMVALVTDGSAVLGLGDLGPEAALPVVEGKAMLFRTLADLNAVPICLGTRDPGAIVETVVAIAPGFGAIELDAISAPRCFAVESALRDKLGIPVLHDDQHGTAIVVLAALRNALRVVDKDLSSARIVVAGAGAAGTAVVKQLLGAGARDVVVCVPAGILHPGCARNLPLHKFWLAANTNPRGLTGTLRDALTGADVFIGVSRPRVLDPEWVAAMAPDPIVFALANPDPEVNPAEIADVAAVVATGRPDYPNHINNALACPGLFRGALDARARRFNRGMFLAAVDTLAGLVGSTLGPQRLLPDVLDPEVVPAVAAAVAERAVPVTSRPAASRKEGA